MVTGGEMRMWADISSIAGSLKRIADALDNAPEGTAYHRLMGVVRDDIEARGLNPAVQISAIEAQLRELRGADDDPTA